MEKKTEKVTPPSKKTEKTVFPHQKKNISKTVLRKK